MVKKLFSTFVLVLVLSFSFLGSKVNFSLADYSSNCPTQTTFTSNSATLVGEIQNTGGDPNITGWFEWGSTYSLGYSTPYENFYVNQVPFRFCANINNLQPCTTYYYRAVAQNSGGINRGEIKSFTTTCSPASVDIKANNSDTNITISYGDPLTISWTSSNANSCTASGNAPNWAGSKPTSGSQSFNNLNIGNYTFTLTCYGNNGSSQDSVSVNITARPPVVITLPAVQTW